MAEYSMPDTADLSAILQEQMNREMSLDPRIMLRRFRTRLRICRRSTKHLLDTAVVGLILDVLNVVLSLCACGLYVYEADNDSSAWLYDLELALSAWFSFDYVLRVCVADNWIEAVLSREMMIDLLSILPVFAELAGRGDVQILGIMRVLKILRLLRVQRLLSYFGDDEVMKQGFFMLLTFTFVIFFGAGMYHYVENLPAALKIRYEDEYGVGSWNGAQKEKVHFMFGTAAYFVVVTMTTVGFGDVTPTTGLSQFVTALMIMTTVIIVPFQTNELLRRISDQSIWNKKRYTPRKGTRHVLVAGTVNSNGLAYFVDEFFNADQLQQEEDTIVMVVMAPCPPAQDVLDLLSEPKFANVVIYVAGSVLSNKDLARAAAANAEAIWLLSDKFASNPGEEDALTILRSLQLRKYLQAAQLTSGRGSMPPVYTQLIQPENRPKLAMSSWVGQRQGMASAGEGTTSPRGQDGMRGASSMDAEQAMDETVTLCLEELKMVILAKSVATPGVFTLFNNLVTSGDVLENVRYSNPWEAQYQAGTGHEIYRVKLASSFDGLTFFQVAAAAYDAFRVLVIAVEQDSQVQVAPESLTLDSSKSPYGYVITEDSAHASQLESFDRGPTGERSSFIRPRTQSRSNIKQDRENAKVEESKGDSASVSATKTKRVAPSPVLTTSPTKALGEMGSPVGQGGALGHSSLDLPSPLTPSAWTSKLEARADMIQQRYHFTVKRSLMQAEIWSVNELLPLGVTWDQVPLHRRHLVVCGATSDLYHFILHLRAKLPGDQREDSIVPIVLMLPNGMGSNEWNRLSTFPMVFFVHGSPLSTEDLIRAGVQHAQKAVVFADSHSSRSKISMNDSSPEAMKAAQEMEAMADADTVFINSALHALNPNLHIISELVHNANLPFLNEVNMQGETDDNVLGGPWFASGRVYVSSLNDYLSAQLYHNPRLVTLLEKIIVGTSIHDASASTLADRDTVIELVNPFTLPHAEINLRPMPTNIKWKHMFGTILRHKAVPIGLYRGVALQSDELDFGNRIPYVVTHPDPESKVREQDRVFVLVCRKYVYNLKKGELTHVVQGTGILQDPSVASTADTREVMGINVGSTDAAIAELQRRVTELEGGARG